jgi:DNA-binding GntR family transcriptional regulator
MQKSLAERVYIDIKKDIISCKLLPGSILVQQQLADQYGAGITPTREALQKLAKERLVQSIPRFGYVVTPVTFLDVQELFELRLILEAATVRLAVDRASVSDLEKLSELANYTYIYQDRDSYSKFLSHNIEFHMAIAGISKNHRLELLLSQLLDELTRVFHLGLDLRDSAEEMRSEHRALVSALQAKDAHLAGQIIHDQVSKSMKRVLEALQARPSNTGFSSAGPSIQVFK